MTPEIFAAATTFAAVASFTPGPNNAMLMASGVNYGFARTAPHIAGVTIGYGVMFAAVALGVGQFVLAHPALHAGLKLTCAAYLVWLAWRIATSSGDRPGEEAGQPQSFLQAALFQWINPKGIAGAVALSTGFVDPTTFGEDVAILLAMLFVVSLASASTWALFGLALRGFLAEPRRRRIFNIAMALALVATLWPMLAYG